jgi:hypothetical protein
MNIRDSRVLVTGGTYMVGVHVGAVETDVATAFDVEKIPPATVARPRSTRGRPMSQRLTFDDYSRAIEAGLSDDQDTPYPQTERELLAMTSAGTTVT